MISILRAAMPFVEGVLEVFPDSRLGVVSASRVEEKPLTPDYEFKVDMPYFKCPALHPNDTLIIADPMLASGSTVVAVLEKLCLSGRPKRVIVASVVSAPLGLEKLHARHPDVEVYTSAVDYWLNDHGYIVPGLGDAGDRVCK